MKADTTPEERDSLYDKAQEICAQLLPHTTSRFNVDLVRVALTEQYKRGLNDRSADK